MKVALITPEFPPDCGGIGYYVFYLAKALAAAGVDATVMVRARADREEKTADGVRVRYLGVPGIPPFNHPLFRRRLGKEMRRGGWGLAHIHSSSMPALREAPTVLTSHWCIKEGTRLFYRPIDNYESLYRNIMFKAYCLAENRLIRGCGRFTVVSGSMGEDYLRHYGVKSTVVYNGVDAGVFRPAKKKRSGDKVVYIGSLKRGKGVLDLLDAIVILNRTNPRINYYIYGSGPLKGRIGEYIAGRSLRNVHMPGPVRHDELAGILAEAAVFVLPSYYEGLPNSILEAMACETPVAASAVKGSSELVSHEVNGLLFEKKNPADLAEKLGRLLGSPRLRAEMGRNGRTLVTENYTWEMVAGRFADCYKGV
ncbi:MAG: glycosyltransferase family 4 protein [Deltaproteobacteria bacterium]|nr:glycosyltransferase family 4 protein [Deltaproteobacteria bacterium]